MNKQCEGERLEERPRVDVIVSYKLVVSLVTLQMSSVRQRQRNQSSRLQLLTSIAE